MNSALRWPWPCVDHRAHVRCLGSLGCSARDLSRRPVPCIWGIRKLRTSPVWSLYPPALGRMLPERGLGGKRPKSDAKGTLSCHSRIGRPAHLATEATRWSSVVHFWASLGGTMDRDDDLVERQASLEQFQRDLSALDDRAVADHWPRLKPRTIPKEPRRRSTTKAT